MRATPEMSSVAVRLTLTAVRFQPTAFGVGQRLAVVTGGVLSGGLMRAWSAGVSSRGMTDTAGGA